MFNVMQNLNWISIVLATLSLSLLGGVWFTVLFGKAYALALGREGSSKEKPAPIYILGPLICGLVTTIAMAILIYAFEIESYVDAIVFGGIVGVGLLASTTINTGINPNIPRPLVYGLVSGSYFLLSGLLASIILVAMK